MAGGIQVSVVPKKPKQGPLVSALQVRVDADLRRRLDTVSSETGHSISDVIRLLLVAGLELHEGKRKT